MSLPSAAIAEDISEDGYALLAEVFSAVECGQLASELELALNTCRDDATALRRSNGSLYGARNLLEIFPAARSIWQRKPLLAPLREMLGKDFGLVRGLFFDKSPESNWSLPWHQDLTIAVQDNSLPSLQFKNATRKAGVPHVEAPRQLLEQMLTLRIHLDHVTADNGPLRVLAGSHRANSPTNQDRDTTILARAGDVLAMRPLLFHCSSSASSPANLHRRIIHLEFAGCRELPDGYRWRHFLK